MKNTTIVLLIKDMNICLGMKKRGHGEGKWNGFGGKVKKNETTKEAAIRELYEETSLLLNQNDITKVAELIFEEKPENWLTSVFMADKWQGEPLESEEMRPKWFELNHIPYYQMWPSDSIWLPKVLSGERFKALFRHDNRNKTILKKTFPLSCD